jgi:hypothetical protein
MLKAIEPNTPYFVSKVGMPTIGTDPEVFVKAGLKILPAFEFLPENGEARWDSYSRSYWDGFQAEFETHGRSCLMEMCRDIQSGLSRIWQQAMDKDASSKFTLKSVIKLRKETRLKAFDPHIALGCQPSYNIYDLKGESVGDPRELPYRFAGGHIHFGFSSFREYPEKVKSIVSKLDAILGVWSVGAAQSFDNPIRRKYYGLAGEHRLPKHGIEYRTLSNFWLSSPIVYQATFILARKAAMLGANEEESKFWVAPQEMVIECIQTQNVKLAREILELNKATFQWLLKPTALDSQKIERLRQVGLNGIESIITDPDNIEKNWMLGEGGTTVNPYQETNPKWTWSGFTSNFMEGQKA